MQSQLEGIIHNLRDCFDGKPWYGISVMKKLNAVPWQITNEKTYGNKSIAVLVQHIINWRIFVLKKLEGDLAYDIVLDGENDWDEIHIANQGEWASLKSQLRSPKRIS